jgi:4-hydroxy-3-polyprenylbenzoate decarboxylase
MGSKRIVAAITGASGAAYAVRLLRCMTAAGVDVHLVVSPYGRQLLADEADVHGVEPELLVGDHADRLTIYAHQDLSCRLASGSFLTDGMVVCPCSSNTLGAIAAGLGDNLVSRAAAVTLKEARRLVLVTREMPLSPIDIENMLKVSRAGGIICPAAPGFYHRPRRVEDLVDFVVSRVLDLLGIVHSLGARWEQPGRLKEVQGRGAVT